MQILRGIATHLRMKILYDLAGRVCNNIFNARVVLIARKFLEVLLHEIVICNIVALSARLHYEE
jgi:hypothetical protein